MPVGYTTRVATPGIRRVPYVGVPRAVLDERVRRGVAAGGTNPDDADLHAYYTFQVHVRTRAD